MTAANAEKGFVTGPSGSFTVPSASGVLTKIKIKFQGKNNAGYGAATPTYSYSINLLKPYKYGDTILQSEAQAKPGLDITSIISTTVGTESVLDYNTKFLQVDSVLYSVADLIEAYLIKLLNDQSIKVSRPPDGTMTRDGVMIISWQNSGGIVLTVVTGSLFTTADSDSAIITDTGNIEICIKNIKITLYPASANQTVFQKTIESYAAGWTVSYGAGHLVLVNIPEVENYNKMAFRFQFYADRSNLTGTGESLCQIAIDVNGTVVVTYPDGMKQNLVQFIHDSDVFAAVLAKDGQACAINWETGQISIKDANGNIWEGMPEYKLYKWISENPEIQTNPNFPGKNFISNIGTQFIKEK